MKNLDLRLVGSLFGHSIFVDVANTLDVTEDGGILSARDIEEFRVRDTMKKAFDLTPSEADRIFPHHELCSIRLFKPCDCGAEKQRSEARI